jgi:hypothetical protein
VKFLRLHPINRHALAASPRSRAHDCDLHLIGGNEQFFCALRHTFLNLAGDNVEGLR